MIVGGRAGAGAALETGGVGCCGAGGRRVTGVLPLDVEAVVVEAGIGVLAVEVAILGGGTGTATGSGVGSGVSRKVPGRIVLGGSGVNLE
jgi:hypothetical protein